jgi:hypothetical protein
MRRNCILEINPAANCRISAASYARLPLTISLMRICGTSNGLGQRVPGRHEHAISCNSKPPTLTNCRSRKVALAASVRSLSHRA